MENYLFSLQCKETKQPQQQMKEKYGNSLRGLVYDELTGVPIINVHNI